MAHVNKKAVPTSSGSLLSLTLHATYYTPHPRHVEFLRHMACNYAIEHGLQHMLTLIDRL